MGQHAASERGGWAIRLHYKAGGSGLNCFSLGDVVVYDTEDEAKEKADEIMRSYGGGSLYEAVTVEKVEKGAWAPLQVDALTVAALAYVERAADAGDPSARRLGNQMRASLSPYAPDHMKAPR